MYEEEIYPELYKKQLSTIKLKNAPVMKSKICPRGK